jgi:hypothetical protein
MDYSPPTRSTSQFWHLRIFEWMCNLEKRPKTGTCISCLRLQISRVGSFRFPTWKPIFFVVARQKLKLKNYRLYSAINGGDPKSDVLLEVLPSTSKYDLYSRCSYTLVVIILTLIKISSYVNCAVKRNIESTISVKLTSVNDRRL